MFTAMDSRNEPCTPPATSTLAWAATMRRLWQPAVRDDAEALRNL